MLKYKIIKQISLNNRTGERKERYVVVVTYSTWIERFFNLVFLDRYVNCYSTHNKFNTLEEAREYKERIENPITYTHKSEVVE